MKAGEPIDDLKSNMQPLIEYFESKDKIYSMIVNQHAK
jgi:hypothetical protein